MTLILQDDGTLDTVMLCNVCGKQERFDSEHVERTGYGNITKAGMTEMQTDHDEWCEGITEEKV